MIRTALAALAALTVFASAAQARPHADGSGSVTQFCGDRVCGMASENRVKVRVQERKSKTATIKSVKSRHAARHPRPDRAKAVRTTYEARIVPHPHGCPSYAFCGCGVSTYVFGRPIRSLWLASNWFRFPSAAPGPGMIAVRSGHVFAIIRMIEPGLALAYDPNSGRHLTRVHARRLAGFSVRDPHAGGRLAWLR